MINYILNFLLTIIATVIVITTVIIIDIIIITIITIIIIVMVIIIIVTTIVIIVISTSDIIIIDFCLNYKLNRITNVPFYLSLSHSYLLYLLLFHYAFAYANTPLPSLHIYQSTCSDLLPGGVDRALQHGGHGVHHPLLSLSDDSSPSTRRPSGTYEYLLTVHGALSLLSYLGS